ncbi:MAG: FAD-dependent oxidoreductase [Woeseiaceae bacterium]
MRVLICGAGIAGLTLAWCLERRGHDLVVVERAPRLRDDGYMIDFFGSGFGTAERLGLLADLEAIHYPVGRLTFVNQHGEERFSVPYAALRRRLFNNRHFNFMRGARARAVPAVHGPCGDPFRYVRRRVCGDRTVRGGHVD